MDKSTDFNMNALHPVAASGVIAFSPPSATGAMVNVSGQKLSQIEDDKALRLSKAKIENAVLSYIRALRTLEKTEVTVGVISKALNLKHSDVLEAIASLNKKGVKLK